MNNARYAFLIALAIFLSGCAGSLAIRNPANPDQGLEFSFGIGPVDSEPAPVSSKTETREPIQQTEPKIVREVIVLIPMLRPRRATDGAQIERLQPREHAPQLRRVPSREVQSTVAQVVTSSETRGDTDGKTAIWTAIEHLQTDTRRLETRVNVTERTITAMRWTNTTNTRSNRTNITNSTNVENNEVNVQNTDVNERKDFTVNDFQTWLKSRDWDKTMEWLALVMVPLFLVLLTLIILHTHRNYVATSVERQQRANDLTRAQNEARQLVRERESSDWGHEQQRAFDGIYHQVEMGCARETRERTNLRIAAHTNSERRDQEGLNLIHQADVEQHRREMERTRIEWEIGIVPLHQELARLRQPLPCPQGPARTELGDINPNDEPADSDSLTGSWHGDFVGDGDGSVSNVDDNDDN